MPFGILEKVTVSPFLIVTVYFPETLESWVAPSGTMMPLRSTFSPPKVTVNTNPVSPRALTDDVACVLETVREPVTSVSLGASPLYTKWNSPPLPRFTVPALAIHPHDAPLASITDSGSPIRNTPPDDAMVWIGSLLFWTYFTLFRFHITCWEAISASISFCVCAFVVLSVSYVLSPFITLILPNFLTRSIFLKLNTTNCPGFLIKLTPFSCPIIVNIFCPTGVEPSIST